MKKIGKKMRVHFAQDTAMSLDILSRKRKCVAGAPDIFELFEMQQVAGKYGGGYNSDALCQPMPCVPAFFDLAWKGKEHARSVRIWVRFFAHAQ